MDKVVTFGEVMLRLSPCDGLRFEQAVACDCFFGGSEANVAVALSHYGVGATFVSKLPKNVFGDAAVARLRGCGVDVSEIVRGGKRIGMYMAERGADPCSAICTYDRDNSSFAKASIDEFEWDRILKDKQWFHFSGITPALDPEMENICVAACKAARRNNVLISCDVNYRSKLWDFDRASEVMRHLCQYVNVLIVNEEEARLFGIDVANEDLTNSADFTRMAEALGEEFREISLVASVARINNNTAVRGMLWSRDDGIIASDAYALNVVDPIGAGDAFCAGLIYGLLNDDISKSVLNFAVAACAAKHTVHGDFNLAGTDEIRSLAKTSGVKR